MTLTPRRPSDWRAFAGARYRPFQAVGIGQGAVGALAGGAVTTPLLLQLGAPPALAMLVGVLPAVGALSQLALPSILRRTGGNLRSVTLLVAAIADTRGLWLAAIVLLAAAGIVPAPLAIAAVALVSVTAATLGGLTGTTVLAWFAAVLPETERRIVSPRVATVGAVAGVVLLVPAAALLTESGLGLWAYVLPLLAGGLGGVVGIVGLAGLPRPGRVHVPARAGVRLERPLALDRFLRTACVGAFGFGIAPSLSIYAIEILHLSAGFTVALAAVGTVASLVGSAVAATLLARGSSSRLLRLSYVIRVGAAAAAILALPAGPLAAPLLVMSVIVGAAGDYVGYQAGTERLLRLAAGPASIAHQADYVAATSIAVAGAQVIGVGAVAIGGGTAALPYVALFVASGIARVVAAVRLEVTPPTGAPSTASTGVPVRPSVAVEVTPSPADPVTPTGPVAVAASAPVPVAAATPVQIAPSGPVAVAPPEPVASPGTW